jgi:hypothetical protein
MTTRYPGVTALRTNQRDDAEHMIYEASWRSLATRPRGKRRNERSPRSTALSLSASASACVSKRRISIGITKVHLDKYVSASYRFATAGMDQSSPNRFASVFARSFDSA